MRVIGRIMAMLVANLPLMIIAIVMRVPVSMVLALDAMAFRLRCGSECRVVADRVRRRAQAEREPKRQREQETAEPHEFHDWHGIGLAIGTLTKD
jgi:uncharacterized protein YacL